MRAPPGSSWATVKLHLCSRDTPRRPPACPVYCSATSPDRQANGPRVRRTSSSRQRDYHNELLGVEPICRVLSDHAAGSPRAPFTTTCPTRSPGGQSALVVVEGTDRRGVAHAVHRPAGGTQVGVASAPAGPRRGPLHGGAPHALHGHAWRPAVEVRGHHACAPARCLVSGPGRPRLRDHGTEPAAGSRFHLGADAVRVLPSRVRRRCLLAPTHRLATPDADDHRPRPRRPRSCPVDACSRWAGRDANDATKARVFRGLMTEYYLPGD